MTKREIIVELVWLILLLTMSIIFVGLVFGFNGESMDIQLHDTYYSFSGGLWENVLGIWIFLVLAKYALQGIMVLAKQNIVVSLVMIPILLYCISMVGLAVSIGYSSIGAIIPGGEEYNRTYQQQAIVGVVVYTLVEIGLVTMLFIIAKETILKIRLLLSRVR